VEALKAVYGGKAGFGVVEGEKLPVHRATVARCGALMLAVHGSHPSGVPLARPNPLSCGFVRDRFEDGCQIPGKARLCGRVGEGVGGTVGQDVRLGHFQDRDTGREFVQAAPDDRLLHGEDAPAEPVVIPAAPPEGSVDE